MEGLYTWLESLICYFVLLFAVLHVLPDNSYRKYMQYYMGLLLILVALSPLFKLSGVAGKIDAWAEEFREEAREWEEKADVWEKQWQEEAGIIEGQEVVP